MRIRPFPFSFLLFESTFRRSGVFSPTPSRSHIQMSSLCRRLQKPCRVPELGSAFAGHCHGNVNNNLLFFPWTACCHSSAVGPRAMSSPPQPSSCNLCSGKSFWVLHWMHWIHLRKSAKYLCFSRWKSSRQSVFTLS